MSATYASRMLVDLRAVLFSYLIRRTIRMVGHACHLPDNMCSNQLYGRPSKLESSLWKYAAAISQLLYVWVLVCSALSIAPMFPLLGAQFHLDQQQLSLLTGVNVITLGLANILIVPLSNIFGRRPISIIFGVLVILTNIWQALATSHRSFLAARACNGLVSATDETIMVQVIADM